MVCSAKQTMCASEKIELMVGSVDWQAPFHLQKSLLITPYSFIQFNEWRLHPSLRFPMQGRPAPSRLSLLAFGPL
jgi:hypothetical protein